MLQGVRVVLTAYTASFRVPSFVRHQLTLPVPPLSTVYGLLSAAAGRLVFPEEVEWLAFRCEAEGRGMDLEAIYQFERRREDEMPRPKSYPKTRTVIQREFLVFPRLTLYLPSDWRSVWERPRYALLLGRTQDVAAVEQVAEATLEPVEEGEVEGVLLPRELIFREAGVPCLLYNLPLAFSAEPHRQPLGMGMFGVVTRAFRLRAPGWLWQDRERKVVFPLYRKEWLQRVWPHAFGQDGP